MNCGDPAQDAHHIIERRLWPDGGYYLANGASLCGPCHIKAEKNYLTPVELRKKAGIIEEILPPNVPSGTDKWGEPMTYIKYPRTPHLPWSPGATDDDIRKTGFPELETREVVVLEKMDGENTTMYRDHIHARSLEPSYHPSRTWVGNLHGAIKHEIPEGWRICGENLQAVHSIKYDALHSFFQVFSIWNDENICLSWDETVEWTELLGLSTVPVIWRGKYDDDMIMHKTTNILDFDRNEGYVVRLVGSFHYDDFIKYVGKFVRANHVQSSEHWRSGQMTENKMA